MTVSLELGDLPGCSSVPDLPEHHRLDVRAGLYSLQIPALMLQAGEGNRVQVDPDATLHSEHIGDKADGMSGQDIALQRRIIVAERGYELVATITNYGVEEAGITGVRLAAVSGLLVEKDAGGHYHLADINPGPWAQGVISFLMRRNCMSSWREWCRVQLCIPAGLPSMVVCGHL